MTRLALKDTFERPDGALSGASQKTADSGHEWSESAGDVSIASYHLVHDDSGGGGYANVNIGRVPRLMRGTFRFTTAAGAILMIASDNLALNTLLHFRMNQSGSWNFQYQINSGGIATLSTFFGSLASALAVGVYHTMTLEFFGDTLKVTFPDGTVETFTHNTIRLISFPLLTYQMTDQDTVQLKSAYAVPASRAMIAP